MFRSKRFPREGQWLQFALEGPQAHAVAEAFGAWKQRDRLFVGLLAPEGRTARGEPVLPERINLVDERGHNVPGVLDGEVFHALWLLRPGQLPAEGADEVLARWRTKGCLGVASSLAPVTHKEDVPPGRRPDFHPLP